MLDQPIRVAWLPANIDACALYRMYIPYLNLTNGRFVFSPGKMPLHEFSECQVAVVQRQVTKGNLEAIRLLKSAGMKVIYDTDDNLWSLPAYNPGKAIFETYQEGFGICARECDLITVSTQGLRSAVRSALPNLKQEIMVVPNAMDFKIFRSQQLEPDGFTLVGWAGSNTHSGDLKEAWRILPEIVEENPKVKLAVVGMEPPEKLRHHPRVWHHDWVPVAEFANRFASWGWDITLAPLEDNRFNRSKSCIKMLEAAALRIPCLASWVQPYIEFCALGKLDYLLVKTASQWKKKLQELINEPELRRSLGEEMHRVASTFYNIDKIKENWKFMFAKVLQ